MSKIINIIMSLVSKKTRLLKDKYDTCPVCSSQLAIHLDDRSDSFESRCFEQAGHNFKYCGKFGLDANDEYMAWVDYCAFDFKGYPRIQFPDPAYNEEEILIIIQPHISRLADPNDSTSGLVHTDAIFLELFPMSFESFKEQFNLNDKEAFISQCEKLMLLL